MANNKAGVENGAAAGAGAAATPTAVPAALVAGFGALLETAVPGTVLLEDDIDPRLVWRIAVRIKFSQS